MKSQYNKFFILVALLLTVSLACVGLTSPTATLAPTNPPPPTSAPTSAPLPTIAPPPTSNVPEPPPTSSGDQPSSAPDFFTEEFENGVDNWSYFTTKNDSSADDSGAQPIADNGFLIMDIGKYLNVYALYEPYIYGDVRLDARVDNRGTNNNNINLVCRYSDEGWYEISIANNGLYWLYAYDGRKGSYTLLADGGSNKIASGKETNEYTFICNDRNLIVKINGFDTTTFTDNQFVFREGQIGVGLSSFRDTPIKVEFDWVSISQP